MKVNRKVLIVATATAAFAAAGAGIAQAVGTRSEERLNGPNAEQASRAALTAVGGGTVLEVERQDGDGAGIYEVEVRRVDGSQVEVHLDGSYRPVGTVSDDDTGAEQDGDTEGAEGSQEG